MWASRTMSREFWVSHVTISMQLAPSCEFSCPQRVSQGLYNIPASMSGVWNFPRRRQAARSWPSHECWTLFCFQLLLCSDTSESFWPKIGDVCWMSRSIIQPHRFRKTIPWVVGKQVHPVTAWAHLGRLAVFLVEALPACPVTADSVCRFTAETPDHELPGGRWVKDWERHHRSYPYGLPLGFRPLGFRPVWSRGILLKSLWWGYRYF